MLDATFFGITKQSSSPRRFGLGLVAWLVAGALVVALIWIDPVGRRSPVDAPRLPVPSSAPVAIDAAIAIDAAVAERPLDAPLDAPPPVPLYTVTEALDDVFSGQLVFVGTGEWFGNASIHACAYRNERVMVVTEYCTVKETPALGLVVLSPTRGRVKIYAEADAAISSLSRAKYFDFRVEVQPPLVADPFALAFTYAELRAWDERRYNARLGACWRGNGQDGCSEDLEPRLAAWLESAKPFLEAPPGAWYGLTKELHTRAVRDRRR